MKISLKIIWDWVDYSEIPQEKAYIKINCLRFGYPSDTQDQKEKWTLRTAWRIYWGNLWEKKRFSEKQARELFELTS